MKRGIYIVANDRVMENAIALLNSIRAYNQNIPVILIPFNHEYQLVAEKLAALHQVQIFPDLEFLDQFTQDIGNIFDRDFLKLPNKMRKLAAWFGPLDEFLYIDTDIVVFEDMAATLDQLKTVDFFCCDFHYSGEKLRNIFSPYVIEHQIFTETELKDVFNSGFWGSKKGVITQEKMYETLKECAQHKEYFDFTQGVTDQPVMNYLVLKNMPKRSNLVKTPDGAPGNWGGSSHFKEIDHVLYDNGKRLKYIHWAGTAIKPGGSYWKIWEHYRYLHEDTFPWQRKLRRLVPFMTRT